MMCGLLFSNSDVLVASDVGSVVGDVIAEQERVRVTYSRRFDLEENLVGPGNRLGYVLNHELVVTVHANRGAHRVRSRMHAWT